MAGDLAACRRDLVDAVVHDMTTRKVDHRLDLPVKFGVTVADDRVLVRQLRTDTPLVRAHGLALTDDGRTLCLGLRVARLPMGKGPKHITMSRLPRMWSTR